MIFEPKHYEANNYEQLIGVTDFSEQLLRNHFTLYQGYVKNTNTLLDHVRDLVKQNKESTPEFSELKRRLGWEFNGMRLHEYYFDNLIGQGTKLPEHCELAKKITEDFGSYQTWEKYFKGIGKMRGIGWVVLFYDPLGFRLVNAWIDEHDTGLLAGCSILLVMDVFEHAFMLDYGTNKADYIEAFLRALHWEEASCRLHEAGLSAKHETEK